MKIISSNENFVAVLKNYLKNFLETDHERLNNLTLIDVNTVLNPKQIMLDRTDFASAQKIVNDPQRIVILISMMKEDYLMENNEYFRVLMAYPNVGFVDSLTLKKIPHVYVKLVSGQKEKDEDAIAFFETRQKEKAISVLRYNLDYALMEESRRQEWFKQANSLGFEGDEEQIIKQVRRWLPRADGFLQDKFFEGIFVDAYGTLFDSDWRLNAVVKSAIDELVALLQKKVFIISDSEKWLVEKKKAEYGVTWEFLSKYDLKGTILETVVDNLLEEDFLSQHDICALRYINVSEISNAINKIASLVC